MRDDTRLQTGIVGTVVARDVRGLIKLVGDAATDRLLGGRILAPEGADSLQTLALALQHGMTTRALGDTIFPCLTTLEGPKLAAQAFGKDVAKLSCCAARASLLRCSACGLPCLAHKAGSQASRGCPAAGSTA